MAVLAIVACAGRTALDIDGRPVHVPRDEPPKLENRASILAGMARAVRLTERTGEVEVFVLVDRAGTVHTARVVGGGDDPVLETMAQAVARAMCFWPARREGKPVPVWASRRLAFRWAGGVGGAAVTRGEEADSVRLPPVDSALAAEPAQTREETIPGLEIRERHPLVVLNGVPLEDEEELRRLRDVRFDKLQSVELLGPEAARRRYGPAAEHGAVLLTVREEEGGG